MSSIDELRERVRQAEERFGVINEAHAKYSERLVGLMDAIEARLHEQNAEIEHREAEIEAARNAMTENQALRGMLHSLLRAIEAGGRDVLSEAMQAMDAKVSALIAENVKDAGTVAYAQTAVPSAIQTATLGPLPELAAPAAAIEEAPQIEAATSDLDPSGFGPADFGFAEFAPSVFGPNDFGLGDFEPEEEDAEAEADPGLGPLPDIARSPEDETRDAPEDETRAESEPEPQPEIEPEPRDGEPGAESTAAEAALLETFAPLGQDAGAPAEDMADAQDVPDPFAEETLPDDLMEAPFTAAPEAPEPTPEPEIAAEVPEVPEAPEATRDASHMPQAETAGGPPIDLEEDAGEAATLEEIMRRVSRLVEEEGLEAEPPAGAPVSEQGFQEPEAEDIAPSGPDRAVSNG